MALLMKMVYVHYLSRFVDPAYPNKVYKVIKALYGLHQAPRAWNETLSSFLIENGFRRGTIDKTLFNKRKKSDIMLVQVYVDDIIFGSTKRTATTPIESNKPLVKDEDGVDVDVHVYRDSPFELEAYSESDYRGASLDRKSTTEYVAAANCYGQKPNESVGFTEFWENATVRTLANGTQQLVASIDSKEYTIIRRPSVRKGILYHCCLLCWQGEGSAQPAEPHHTPVDPISSTPHSPLPSPPHPSPPPHSPLPSPPHPSPPPPSPHQSPPFSPPHYSPPRSYEAPLPEGNISGSTEDTIQLKELMDIVPKLVSRIETLETELQQTKTTYGKAVLTLVKRVKILEKSLKRKTQKVVISGSEGEEPEDQGRKIQDIDDDPLVSLVRESMKEKSTDFVTPTKASGEAQEEDISPTILEAAKTLSKVASQGVSKVKSTDKGKRYRRRARSVAKIINTGLDAEEEILKLILVLLVKGGQREGKAPMVEEDIQATHKTKEQIRQEAAGLEEAIKLQAQMDEEVAKQIHLDKMIAKRMVEEEELSEQQKKRKAEVQEAAQNYTEEDWDTIRAKLEANAELTKSLQGESMTGEDFAKRMVEMINQKKKFYAE
ncbi:putative ribonuclease H-like domain-containing protein [Tanacetum coccineum]